MNEMIRKLMEKRANVVAQMRAMLDKAEGENRSLSGEEQGQYDALNKDIENLTKRIKDEERVAALEAENASSANGGAGNPGTRNQPGQHETRAAPNSGAEYRHSVLRYLVGGLTDERLIRDNAPESRAVLGVNIGTPTAGGYLAPTELERTILDFTAEFSAMRRLASIRSSSSNIEIPYSTGKTTAYHMDEGADFTKSTPSWNKMAMGAHKIGALSVVTHEAMEDMFIDLEGWCRDDFGRAFAALEEEDFIKGDGVKKPTGVLTSASAGITSASATAITTDELIDMQHALKRQCRAKARWMFNDATVKFLRKLKDTEGRYIWQPSLTAGAPDLVLNKPYEISEHLDTLAANKVVALYGDFSWYRILDRRGLYFQRLSELYAGSGQVGFLAYKRYDGKLLDKEAVIKLTTKAS